MTNLTTYPWREYLSCIFRSQPGKDVTAPGSFPPLPQPPNNALKLQIPGRHINGEEEVMLLPWYHTSYSYELQRQKSVMYCGFFKDIMELTNPFRRLEKFAAFSNDFLTGNQPVLSLFAHKLITICIIRYFGWWWRGLRISNVVSVCMTILLYRLLIKLQVRRSSKSWSMSVLHMSSVVVEQGRFSVLSE